MMPLATSSSYVWSYVSSIVDYGIYCNHEIVDFIWSRLEIPGNESYDHEALLREILHSHEFREKFILSLTQWEWVMVYIFAAVFVLAIGGNLLVCFAVFRNEHMQTVTNYYIVNLATSDILMIVLCLPATVMGDLLDSWYLGSLGCRLLPYFQYVSTSVSIFTLAAIAADRYLAICCSLEVHDRAYRTISVIVLIWTVSLIIPSPLSGWHGPYSQKIYHVCLIFILYIIPLCVIAVAYARVCRRLRLAIPTEEARSAPSTSRAKKLLSADGKKRPNIKSSTENQEESRRKVPRMLIVLVCIFALCYFPMHTLNTVRIVMDYDGYACEGTRNNIMTYLFILSHFLMFINSAANPIIYNFLSAKFRRGFQAALCLFLPTKRYHISDSRVTPNTNSLTRCAIRRESPGPSSNILPIDVIRMTTIPKFPEAVSV